MSLLLCINKTLYTLSPFLGIILIGLALVTLTRISHPEAKVENTAFNWKDSQTQASMASIESLLNPLPSSQGRGSRSRYDESIAPFSLVNAPETDQDRGVFAPPRVKKSKMPKDAPVFIKGEVRGEVRYPPCEERDEVLAEQHRMFSIHPMGRISEYPRHIPYSSEKKTLMEKTARESFEVFQYTFRLPGDEKNWTVMWDYNIGLVRTTHLFKCNDYPKTTPAKMLNANIGLREICHSITGGALAAQGYWMPFETAKAVAATFCWKIRYALTPLFGTDFPSLCIPPQSRQFGKMTIDPDIIRQATELSNRYRQLELDLKMANRSQNLLLSPTTSTPQNMVYHQTWSAPIDSNNLDITHQSYPKPGGVVQADREAARQAQHQTVSSSKNTFTPINTPGGATTLLERKESGQPRGSQPRGSTSNPRKLPPLREFIGLADFESSLCENPLKRRLANDADVEQAQDTKLISPKGQTLIASIPRRQVALRARSEQHEDNGNEDDDGDDDLEFDDDSCLYKMSIDDDDESFSSSFCDFDPDSDSDSGAESDLAISSSLQSDSSDEDPNHKTRFCYKKSHDKKHAQGIMTRKQKKEDKKVEMPMRRSSQAHHRRQSQFHSLRNLRRGEDNLSSPSPPAASSSKRKSKNSGDDLKAAETLLALHSGSSTLSGEDDDGDTDTSSPWANNKKRKEKRKFYRHQLVKRRAPGRSSLAVNSRSELYGRTAKRFRRASF
ncbi:hypothetical protein UA08_03334 [Talaromyces atroroseus]|uniref:HTH APSES-type domain-containing protein n=1 Tax=Talaromyces atroroseus TaxID=1441469 RepID=A0A225AT12_TALAT|nr:hypothetical protein UA08_03334 [Talaromyces atroroseus]OKL61494.1 hypothetical protein UA08_03334 [Talaromyces atroroseus]